MKFGLQYMAISKNNTIKALKKYFKTSTARERFISKGFESGTIYKILAYEN